MKCAAVLSASKRFLKTQDAFWVCPSIHGFSRLLDAAIELHQQIVPENPKWPGPYIAYRLLKRVLISISKIVRLWNRWIRS
jgi:hypothetical protein